jgi:hypothetical protein
MVDKLKLRVQCNFYLSFLNLGEDMAHKRNPLITVIRPKSEKALKRLY